MLLKAIVFPEKPRDFRGKRIVKILLRAIHVVFVCGLVGGCFALGELPGFWYVATGLTGLSILLLDLHGSAVFLVQLRGAIVIAKVTTFCLLPLAVESGVAPCLLVTLVVISVVSSHAPAKFRYFMLFGQGRLTPSVDKG